MILSLLCFLLLSSIQQQQQKKKKNKRPLRNTLQRPRLYPLTFNPSLNPDPNTTHHLNTNDDVHALAIAHETHLRLNFQLTLPDPQYEPPLLLRRNR